MRILPVAPPLALADAAGRREGKWSLLYDSQAEQHDVLNVVQPRPIANRYLRPSAYRLPPLPGAAVPQVDGAGGSAAEP